MKRLYSTLILLGLIVLISSCTTKDDRFDLENNEITTRIEFPTDDGSTQLKGKPEEMVKTLLEKVADSNFARNISHITITDDQYYEIADFTANLVKGKTTEEAKYQTVFRWIVSNIKYKHGWVDNNPYAVFTTKEAICQGYSDLLTIMMHTLNIPCFTINGILYDPYSRNYLGGHAWNYVNCDGKWIVSDPTNGGSHSIDKLSDYWYLQPSLITIPVYEDENFKYNYFNYNFNICSVKKDDAQLIVPYSANGIRITSFNPSEEIPGNVTELYLGKNIESIGDNSTQIGIEVHGKSIETIEIDPENSVYESYSNVVYRRNGDELQMQAVAPATTFIELKPMNFDKESRLKDLKKLETIVFVPGTTKIGAWAVENCPKLHTAYVPNETTVENNAFYKVAPNFKIVRGNYTNIEDVRF